MGQVERLEVGKVGDAAQVERLEVAGMAEAEAEAAGEVVVGELAEVCGHVATVARGRGRGSEHPTGRACGRWGAKRRGGWRGWRRGWSAWPSSATPACSRSPARVERRGPQNGETRLPGGFGGGEGGSEGKDRPALAPLDLADVEPLLFGEEPHSLLLARRASHPDHIPLG